MTIEELMKMCDVQTNLVNWSNYSPFQDSPDMHSFTDYGIILCCTNLKPDYWFTCCAEVDCEKVIELGGNAELDEEFGGFSASFRELRTICDFVLNWRQE